MAIGKDTALRLVLVDDQVNEAEAIVSSQRNAGIAVRPLRPESVDELAAQLQQQTVDLVLAEHACRSLPFDEVAAVVGACGRDVPLLAVLDGVSDDLLDAVQAHGAQGVALRSRPQQFLRVVREAWSDLDARRSQRQLEAQVRETERRCDMLIDSSREPIAYIHEGMHIRANPAYLEMFGYESFEDIEGMSLLDLVASQHVAEFKQLLKRLSKGEPPPPRYELTAHDIEGNEFPAVMEFTPAQYEGEPCQQVVFRRQAQGVDPELARQVEELKQRDHATGLLNRPTFLHRLEDAVASAATQAATHGLLLVEPDHSAQLLKAVGLGAGDSLMAALAQRLASAVPPGMATARVGEFQFAVLAGDSDHLQTTQLAEHIRAQFAGHVVEVDEHSLNATVSIGAVQVSEKIASVPQVLAKATHCLQSASSVGGNGVEIFDPAAVDRAEEERIRTWVGRIREALQEDRFVLHYQPIVNLQGEHVEMYETFLRMTTVMGELVPPLSFFQIAEDHGLLPEIDGWVIRRAIAVIAERLAAGNRTSLLVKLSQATLQDRAVLDVIAEAIAQAGIPGELLVFSVPEAKVFTLLRAAQEFQAAVSELGCRVCLEQFGSGLNSTQLLAHFPVDIIKIDRGFMKDLGSSAENQARVRQIATMARSSGMQTIADFVQDAGSITFLFGSGVDYVQGQFMAPVTPTMNYEFG
jgi:diguanylate cyclase (GGDEF)-like protein/PAS domain S-box-containing protein